MNVAIFLLLSLITGFILGACSSLSQIEDKPNHTDIKDWYLPPCSQYEKGSWAEYKCEANSGQGSHQ